ncbi:jg26784 [Pararge aegeria aegeria]|uniref:Jg26784 protein n=1 Tax=Pararge aegeria aegeria TaxID=348720 RepID=A0A8S4SG32_9NEOP|nr:jg26784 [Pararge aegeria aegeria]
MLLIFVLPLLLLEVPDTHAQSYIATQLFDYRCQEPNGYESVSRKCDEYIECKENIAIQHSCPDGLHFNSKVQWPNYPCGYPSEVQCGNGYEIQKAQPSSECSHRYGFSRSDGNDCGTFTLCYEGIAIMMSCSDGLVFNVEKEICDWPINVPECSHSRALEGYTCPATPADEEGNISKNRYGRSCSRFVACQDSYPRLLKCDIGLHFDEKTESCVDAEYVVDCDRD